MCIRDRPDLGLCFIRFLPVMCLITRCLLRFVFFFVFFFRPAGTRDAPRSSHGVYVYLRLHHMKSRRHFSYLAVEGAPVQPDDPLTWATLQEHLAAFSFLAFFLVSALSFSLWFLSRCLLHFLGWTSRAIGISGAPTVISIVHRHGHSAAQATPASPLL